MAVESEAGYYLPIRPKIGAEEGLQSYVARLASANQCERVSWLGEMLDASLPGIVWDVDAATALASIVRADPKKFVDKVYEVEPYGVRTRGHLLPKDAIATHRAGVCPSCLAELGYRPWFWDLTAIAACPDHGVRLVRNCPACEAPVSQLVSSATRCACGYDLSTAPTEAAPSHEIRLAERVRTIIRGEAFRPRGDVGTLDLHGFLELVAVLGRLDLVAEGGKRSSGATLRRGDAAAVLAKGLSTIDDWPDNLFGLLDSIRARGGGSGLATSLRPLYWAIRHLRSATAYDLLTEATVTYLRDRDMAVPMHLAPAGDSFVDRDEMLRQLGIGRWRFERAVVEKRFWLTRYWSPDGRVLFSTQEIDLARQGLLSLMSTSEFRRTVDLFPGQARELLDTGLFYTGSDGDAGIDRTLVDAFLVSLEPRQSEAGIFGYEISFGDLRQAARYRGHNLRDVVRLVWNRDIPVIRQDAGESLFGRLVFDKAQAMAVLDARAPEDTRYMTLSEAEKALDLRRAEINDLRQQRVLEDVHVDVCGRSRIMLARSEVQEFKRRYIAKRSLGDGGRVELRSLLKPGVGLADAVAFRLGGRGHVVLDRTKLAVRN
jgi:hypothetical protein